MDQTGTTGLRTRVPKLHLLQYQINKFYSLLQMHLQSRLATQINKELHIQWQLLTKFEKD